MPEPARNDDPLSAAELVPGGVVSGRVRALYFLLGADSQLACLLSCGFYFRRYCHLGFRMFDKQDLPLLSIYNFSILLEAYLNRVKKPNL